MWTHSWTDGRSEVRVSSGLAGLHVRVRHVSHWGWLHRDGERRDRPTGKRGFLWFYLPIDSVWTAHPQTHHSHVTRTSALLAFLRFLHSPGSSPQVTSFHNRLERQQWERSGSGDKLVPHPGFPEASVPERLCDAICWQHKSDSSGGGSAATCGIVTGFGVN